MSTKKCYKCSLDKPYEEFSKDPNGKYGLSSKCKICSSSTFKEYYEKNKKKHNDMCKRVVVCEDCLLEYRNSAKAAHCKTRKHIYKSEIIAKSIAIEGIKEKE